MLTPLYEITSLARSGALERAWVLFRDGGYEAALDDPAALAVKGRLLKDQAALAEGERRAALLAEAEAAYWAADELAPAPWLLINVAALAALQGEAARAAQLAEAVLARLDAGGVAETPYFLAATRAEALVLRGDPAAASAALAEGIAAQPEGWADHATTLRQLGRILAAQGAAADWLDPHRPPRSLHFAGHLGVAEADSAALGAAVARVLAAQRIGFGYGALAAGADIIIAEALLERGAALHVHLPVGVAEFMAQSVQPYGPGWAARFERCLAAAASVRIATSLAGDGAAGFEPLATALAADTAMGAAVLNARLLESSAVQLLVIDGGDGPFGTGASTARDGAIWQAAGHGQHRITWPRSAAVPASQGKREGRADRDLLALLLVRFDGLEALGDGGFAAALDDTIAPFWTAAKDLPGQPERSLQQGNAALLAFASLPAAAAFARRLHSLDPPEPFSLSIAGDYGLVHTRAVHGAGGVAGPMLLQLSEIAAATQPGTITVSERFATALALMRTGTAEFRLVELGDYPAGALFALQ